MMKTDFEHDIFSPFVCHLHTHTHTRARARVRAENNIEPFVAYEMRTLKKTAVGIKTSFKFSLKTDEFVVYFFNSTLQCCES